MEPGQQGRHAPSPQEGAGGFSLTQESEGQMSKRYTTAYINDESQVPDGYVPMALFDHTTRLHRALSKAHSEGKVRAVKLVRHEGDIKTGPVWVHGGDAEEFRQSHEATRPTAPEPADIPATAPVIACREHDERRVVSAAQMEAAVIALCEINNGITLMHATLERLTAAVENIATQPDYAASMRREITAACESSNGFHN